MRTVDQLYRQVIMEHYKNPRNKGLKQDDKYRTLHLKNPSCGDDVTVQVSVIDNVVKEVRHEGTGCSICCASASIMSELIENKTISETNNIIEDYYRLIKGETPLDIEALEEAQVFVGVAQFPARMKCATLAWKALGAILRGNEGEDIDE